MQPQSTQEKPARSLAGIDQPAEWFRTTQWSALLQAKDDGQSTAARAGLSQVCATYWRPIYSYLRRLGCSPSDAEDITQGFFEHLLRHDWLKNVSPGNGKFRSYLLKALKNYRLNLHAKTTAAKRGGGHTLLPLDELENDGEAAIIDSEALTPEQCFDRSWAEALMTRCIQKLQDEFIQTGKEALYEQLKRVDDGRETDLSYAEIGERMGMSVGAVKSAAYRMRMRLASILHSEVRSTLFNPRDVEEELRYLLQALGH